jgi:hypothetical protein
MFELLINLSLCSAFLGGAKIAETFDGELLLPLAPPELAFNQTRNYEGTMMLASQVESKAPDLPAGSSDAFSEKASELPREQNSVLSKEVNSLTPVLEIVKQVENLQARKSEIQILFEGKMRTETVLPNLTIMKSVTSNFPISAINIQSRSDGIGRDSVELFVNEKDHRVSLDAILSSFGKAKLVPDSSSFPCIISRAHLEYNRKWGKLTFIFSKNQVLQEVMLSPGLLH